MKTIFIETVSNGWIVRLHETCITYVSEPLAVFNRMIDLQTALPDLLADEKLLRPPTVIRRPPTGDDDFIKVGGDRGGDRTSETIGGKELCPSA